MKMRRVILVLILVYKKFLSPALFALIGPACRFMPTCSDYAYEAIKKFGIYKGGKMAIKRVIRCHPGGHDRFDPVPEVISN